MSFATGQELVLRTDGSSYEARVLLVVSQDEIVADVEEHGVQRFVRVGRRWDPAGDRDWPHGSVQIEPALRAPVARRRSGW